MAIGPVGSKSELKENVNTYKTIRVKFLGTTKRCMPFYFLLSDPSVRMRCSMVLFRFTKKSSILLIYGVIYLLD